MNNIPFQDDQPEEKSTSDVKLDGSKSRFAKKPSDNRPSPQEFQEKVSEHQNADNEIKKKIAELSTQFISFIKDQTLPENKGPIIIGLEKDVSRELIDLTLQLNNDETKPEGIGSAGMIMLLLRTVLIQRDIINNISYEVEQLKFK